MSKDEPKINSLTLKTRSESNIENEKVAKIITNCKMVRFSNRHR
jgi:hypothetical protein